MNNNRFLDGLIIGLILGGGMVFLLGTRTGKNLLKILSEQGVDGLVNVLEEYNLDDIDEEDVDDDLMESSENHTNGEAKDAQAESGEKPKKRFFKRFKK